MKISNELKIRTETVWAEKEGGKWELTIFKKGGSRFIMGLGPRECVSLQKTLADVLQQIKNIDTGKHEYVPGQVVHTSSWAHCSHGETVKTKIPTWFGLREKEIEVCVWCGELLSE